MLLYGLSAAGIALAGLSLRWPALTSGFTVDDYAQRGMMEGLYPAKRGPLELFTFSTGRADEVQHLKDVGFFPWWSHPHLKLSMLRPLSSALMWLDRMWFGDDAFAYHLHSLVWWVLLMTAVAWLLHTLLPRGAALLALAFFALDEAHAMPLGWLALRNELVASLFAVLAMGLHMRSTGPGDASGTPQSSAPPSGRPWLVALTFGLALSAGEYAMPFLGYFIAHALATARQLGSAVRRLLPVLLPTCLYLLIRSLADFGSQGTEMYVDPMRDTGHFLRAVVLRLPVLAGDLALALRSDWWGWGVPHAAVLVARGASPAWMLGLQPTWNWLWGLGMLALVLGGLLSHHARRAASDDPAYGHGSWLGPGTLLALVPLLGSYPSSRLLIAPAIGFSALLAILVHRALCRLQTRPVGLGPGLQGALAALVAAYHIVLPSLHTRRETQQGTALAKITRQSILEAEVEQDRIAQQDVVLFGAVDPTTTIYVPLLRALHHRPAPRSCHLLFAAFAPHRLERTDARTFELVRLNPHYTAGDLYGAAFNDEGVVVDQVLRAGPMEVTVLEVEAGLPVRTRHRFDVPLSDPSLVFLHQTAQGLTRVELPPVGKSRLIPAPVPPVSLLEG